MAKQRVLQLANGVNIPVTSYHAANNIIRMYIGFTSNDKRHYTGLGRHNVLVCDELSEKIADEFKDFAGSSNSLDLREGPGSYGWKGNYRKVLANARRALKKTQFKRYYTGVVTLSYYNPDTFREINVSNLVVPIIVTRHDDYKVSFNVVPFNSIINESVVKAIPKKGN